MVFLICGCANEDQKKRMINCVLSRQNRVIRKHTWWLRERCRTGAEKKIAPFSIQIHEVTNQQFSDFVQATGYTSQAEHDLQKNRDDAGSGLFKMPPRGVLKRMKPQLTSLAGLYQEARHGFRQGALEQRFLLKRTILLFTFHLTMPWRTPTGSVRDCRLS